jgi:hypothetical protein
MPNTLLKNAMSGSNRIRSPTDVAPKANQETQKGTPAAAFCTPAGVPVGASSPSGASGPSGSSGGGQKAEQSTQAKASPLTGAAVKSVAIEVSAVLEQVVTYIQTTANHGIRRFGPKFATAGVRIGKGLTKAALTMPFTLYNLDQPYTAPRAYQPTRQEMFKQRRAALSELRRKSKPVDKDWQARDRPASRAAKDLEDPIRL